MALEWIEGFETFITSAVAMAGRYTYFAGTTLAVGRTGRGFTINNNYFSKLLTSQATRTIGFALRVNSIATQTILTLYDGATAQCYLALDGLGRLQVYRTGTPTLLGSSANNTLYQNVWYYIELKTTISDAAGVAIVRVNGTEVLNLSAVDTKNTANATADTVRFGAGGGVALDLDDIYINNDGAFYGDMKVECLRPDGAGTTTQWTPSAGSNYQNVDDVGDHDVDATYNYTSSAGNIDLYTLSNLSVATGTIKGVQVCTTARKDDANARNIRRVLRSGGTNYEGTDIPLASTYVQYTEILETDPATAAAWTIANVNALEAGVKMQS